MSKSTKGPLPPRRKRMKRPERLQAARAWLSAYSGKDVVRGYARWFGTDLWCAVLELRMLGVKIDPKYAEAIKVKKKHHHSSAPPPRDAPSEGFGSEWDENLACIVGFTSGGAPYGTPWEP